MEQRVGWKTSCVIMTLLVGLDRQSSEDDKDIPLVR
jgi:hypothetical protein